VPAFSQGPSWRPDHRIDALHVVTAESAPLPRLATTSSLSQGISFGVCARRIAGGLADDGAAVRVLPARSRVMAPDGLAVREQRRDRLTEGPCELAVGARLALVDCAPSACQVATTVSPGAAIAAGTSACATKGGGNEDKRQTNQCMTHSVSPGGWFERPRLMPSIPTRKGGWHATHAPFGSNRPRSIAR